MRPWASGPVCAARGARLGAGGQGMFAHPLSLSLGAKIDAAAPWWGSRPPALQAACFPSYYFIIGAITFIHTLCSTISRLDASENTPCATYIRKSDKLMQWTCEEIGSWPRFKLNFCWDVRKLVRKQLAAVPRWALSGLVEYLICFHFPDVLSGVYFISQ